MFQGHAKTSLDEKGRIIIPSKFRKHISPEANGVMNVTLGRDNCIWMFPSHEWQKVLGTLSTINPYTEHEVMMRRQMLFHSEELGVDSQHRILIPAEILSKVGIKKDVLLIGQLERIELWHPSNYEKYLKDSPETYEGVMQKVMTNLYSKKSEG